MDSTLLLGNEAIALGLVESGCRAATAYPGTPSSEILAGVVKFKQQFAREIYTEWSSNEKVAFEVALAASWTGLRAAVAMKQVGLNVAADPLFSAAYTGVRGGFLVIAADDPGLHSSQTEQDSRLLAFNAKVPVLDPASPAEARAMVREALALSEQYGVPVVLRPTTRVCHALQSIAVDGIAAGDAPPPHVKFRRDPARWAAAPKARSKLHVELNQKLQAIAAEFEHSKFNAVVDSAGRSRIGVIAAGVVYNTARQTLQELGVEIPLLKIGTPYPLPQKPAARFMARLDTVVVLEEPGTCIELQLPDRHKLRGRLDGSVPAAGELTPEVVADVLAAALRSSEYSLNPAPHDKALQTTLESLAPPLRRPRLCAGCAHRSAFFAVKSEFGPRALYPGDIGCYTLGLNLRAVDTVLDMGASISMAHGFDKANRVVGDRRPIVATIGDSTFLHSGVPALINAVHSGARFVLVILDNHTTAMTGFQPTAASESLADGDPAPRAVSIPALARACGVGFVETVDPYELETFRASLRAAHDHTQAAAGGVAVLIANRPCVLYDAGPLRETPLPVLITEECDGCRYCTEAFECPALVLRADGSRVDIDYKICVDCGQCIDACYKGFILPKLPEAVVSVQCSVNSEQSLNTEH